MVPKIAVIGAGSWGTAIAALLGRKKNIVHLWARDLALAKDIESSRFNPRYLPDVIIPLTVFPTGDIKEALKDAAIVIFAVPSIAMRDVVEKAREFVSHDAIVVSLTKGIERNTLMRMSEVIASELPEEISRNIAVLSGPNHAEEVSKDIPSATVVSAKQKHIAVRLQELFMTPYFRVYTNPDIMGVELGGATKNVIAIAAGISDGLGYGDNTKASLMTRGLAEMTRLGLAMGAKPLTFAGLSGVGDLIATCTSKHSRNRAAGEKVAKGMSVDDISKETTMVAEGLFSSVAINKLSLKYQIEMPITRNVAEVLYEGKEPHKCVSDLMQRGATEEIVW